MSAILDIDNVPHIVRYGMQSDKAGAEECWIQFYRSGVMFTIDVSQDKVARTVFAEEWIPLLDETAGLDLWESLCTLIITASLGTIRRLVVGEDGTENHERWRVLEGYLNTISYRLEVLASESIQQTADAIISEVSYKGVTARVLSGPGFEPSYEFSSFPFDQIGGLYNMGDAFNQLVQYRALDLEVLDASKEWRVPPSKVRAPNGDIFCFIACEATAMDMDAEKSTNSSLDSINAYCKVHKALADVPSPHTTTEPKPTSHIARLHGFVSTDVLTKEGEDLATRQKDVTVTYAIDRRETQTRIAGVLIDPLHHAQSFSDYLAEHDPPSLQLKQKWKAQVAHAIEQLHSLRITIGGYSTEAEKETDQAAETEPFYYLNEHTVMICSRSDGSDSNETMIDAWLSLGAGCTHHEDGDRESYEEGRAMDLKALDTIFGS